MNHRQDETFLRANELHNLLIIGPSGFGKTDIIGNMIDQLLIDGKTRSVAIT
jgi:Cdc6-like AAA superfamily ATPase